MMPKPWVAVAHSMGGCLTLLAMAHGEDRFAGAVLSAPMLGIRSPFPAVLSRLLTSLNLMVGQGGAYNYPAPPIAQLEMPVEAFQAFLREPPNDMPAYAAKIVSDKDAADILAYLHSVSGRKPVKDFPLLAP